MILNHNLTVESKKSAVSYIKPFPRSDAVFTNSTGVLQVVLGDKIYNVMPHSDDMTDHN